MQCEGMQHMEEFLKEVYARDGSGVVIRYPMLFIFNLHRSLQNTYVDDTISTEQRSKTTATQ